MTHPPDILPRTPERAFARASKQDFEFRRQTWRKQVRLQSLAG